MSVGLTLSWQRAWANAELGYEPTPEELALLEDASRRPDYYMSAPARRSKPKHITSRKWSRPYRLPFTVI